MNDITNKEKLASVVHPAHDFPASGFMPAESRKERWSEAASDQQELRLMSAIVDDYSVPDRRRQFRHPAVLTPRTR